MSNRILQPTTNILNHTKDLRKAASRVVGDLQDEAVNQFAGFKGEASSRFSDVRGRASDSWTSLKGLIKQHPFAAVGIGLAGGLVLAGLARRK
jgi:ElaB/YqjD/DUF883 family membrane-anchored ribosome-binding protein